MGGAVIRKFDPVGFGGPTFEFRDPFPVDLKNLLLRVKREFTRIILYLLARGRFLPSATFFCALLHLP